jgi:hypothetical protein
MVMRCWSYEVRVSALRLKKGVVTIYGRVDINLVRFAADKVLRFALSSSSSTL